MSSPLHLDVFVVPYKPIVIQAPAMGKGAATWPPRSMSLISAERDAVLVDTPLTPTDAAQVADWVQATGKNLTTVYITHGHGDHFLGLAAILDAFPTRPPSSAARRPTSATSTKRSPRAIRPRNWSTR